MPEQKQYVPKCGAKLISFERGGHIIKIGFHAESLINFVKANTNERGYINLVVAERREPSPHGDTHSVYLDIWKPKEGGQRSGPAPSAPKADTSNQPPPDEESSEVPF